MKADEKREREQEAEAAFERVIDVFDHQIAKNDAEIENLKAQIIGLGPEMPIGSSLVIDRQAQIEDLRQRNQVLERQRSEIFERDEPDREMDDTESL